MFSLYGVSFFFFNDTATTEIYTLSLHDALPIFAKEIGAARAGAADVARRGQAAAIEKSFCRCCQVQENLLAQALRPDRKSTRLNSSHGYISYAVFCLKKKKITHKVQTHRPQQTH